ncbi:MAG: general secretion pathway protein GspL [Gammaproteobacteria bacterium]|nr:general secretion pathway protein GspL [Gammaproteobacteria bacterium]MBU1442347.1 general secretion pathway protein GspL [Gammaproteobacteria bacterium]MBU2285483.1 general secretion pathway protein GspL [Gammaproteobacteria bacterium]MBU2407594.1 general secretion pathway protein GspL [Gammaproteobacteria bacterium]
MPFLIVTASPTFSPPGGEFAWTLWSGDGRKLRSQGSAPAALLPTSDEVILGVPSAALSWHQVTLPQGSMSGAVRVRSVLNGLLEDRLLDEPEMLHFALEPGARAGTPIWVAACNRVWLRSVVQALEGAGRRVARIIPEFSPQPAGANPMVFAIGEPGAAQLVLCDAQGVNVLPLDGAGVALAGAMPESVSMLAEPAVAEQAEAVLERRMPIVKPAARWLQASRGPWDLSQFDLASTGRARAGKKLASVVRTLWYGPQWRAARWGALTLMVAQLVGVNAWAWKERNALDAKRAAVRNVLTQTFPAVKTVIDAPVQMEREVAALQLATGGVALNDLEPMLSALSTHLPPGRLPTSIDYSAGQLRLRGLGLQPAEVQNLSTTLSARGYGARSEGDLLLVQAEAQR